MVVMVVVVVVVVVAMVMEGGPWPWWKRLQKIHLRLILELASLLGGD